MPVDLELLLLTAASIGVVHTLLGPDHYLPFVAMGAARHWSMRRTLTVTALCGVGHVIGSIVLGALGIGFGLAVAALEWIEGLRGDLAAWLLIGFGLAYLAWGVRQALRARPHSHEHVHADGTRHSHPHDHAASHAHVHDELPTLALEDPRRPARASLTPWALFVIFVLGPCEPLIPVLMYPAAQHSVAGTVGVVLAFAVATITTMLAVVWFARRGLAGLPGAALGRWSHALAGAAIGLCGAGIVFLGL
jgi:ABC-type nickel/cobalt efflux system permease component RcnA